MLDSPRIPCYQQSMHTGTVLQIEPTDLCNLLCPMCAPQVCQADVHRGLRPGFMDMDLYRSIILDIERNAFELDHLIFQWLGEPTLHPELDRMITFASQHLAGLVGYLRVDTNAVALTPSRVDRILEARAAGGPPLLVVFSLDSVTAETYLRVKGRDRFHQVMDNIHHFLERRAAMEGDDPGINTQFQFVLQPDNHMEAGPFVEYWDEVLRKGRNGIGFNEVMIKRISIGTGGEQQRRADDLYDRTVHAHGLAPRDEDHIHLRVWAERTWGEDEDSATAAAEQVASPEATPAAPADPPGRPPCPAPWMTPVIRWDGQLQVCCADTDGAIEVGNVADHGFVDLWRSDRVDEIRLTHLTGDLSALPYCEACGGFTWYELGADAARETLRRTGREELWPEVSRRLGDPGSP